MCRKSNENRSIESLMSLNSSFADRTPSLRNPGTAMPPTLEALITAVDKIWELVSSSPAASELGKSTDCKSFANTVLAALGDRATKPYFQNAGPPSSFEKLECAARASVEAIGNGVELSNRGAPCEIGTIQAAIIGLKLALQDLQKATPMRHDDYDGTVHGI